jgi:hypothetical protein
MKTTFVLPDALVRRAKIRAAERGETLSALVARALETALADGIVREEGVKRGYWSTHKPLLIKSRRKDGKVSDSTKIISDDRDGR